VAKVVVRKLQRRGAKREAEPASVGQKRVRGADGELHTLRTLNAGSKTFSNDLTYVFGKNVAKARRENKRVTGQTDCVPAKN
jgi:hypothetical protein